MDGPMFPVDPKVLKRNGDLEGLSKGSFVQNAVPAGRPLSQPRPPPRDHGLNMTDSQLILGLANGSINPNPRQVDAIQKMINDSSRLVWPIPVRDSKLPRRKISKRFIHSREYVSTNLNYRVLNFYSNFAIYQVPEHLESLALLPCRKCKESFSNPGNELVACRGHCGQTFHQKCYGLQITKDSFFCRKDVCQTKFKEWKERSRELERQARNPSLRERPRRVSRAAAGSLMKPSTTKIESPLYGRVRDRERDRDRERENQVISPPLRTCFDAWLLIERYFDPVFLSSSVKFLIRDDLSEFFWATPGFDALNSPICVKPIREQFWMDVTFQGESVEQNGIANRDGAVWQEDFVGSRKFFGFRMTECDYAVRLRICDERIAQKRALGGCTFDYVFPPCPYSGISSRFVDARSELRVSEFYESGDVSSWISAEPFAVEVDLQPVDIYDDEDDDEICSELWLLQKELESVALENARRSTSLMEKVESSIVTEDLVKEQRQKKLDLLSQYVDLASKSEWCERSQEDGPFAVEVDLQPVDIYDDEDDDEICSELWLLQKELESVALENARRSTSLMEKVESSIVTEDLVKEQRQKKLDLLSQYVDLASKSEWCERSREDLDVGLECYITSRERLFSLSCKAEEEKVSAAKRRASVVRSSQPVQPTSPSILESKSAEPDVLDAEMVDLQYFVSGRLRDLLANADHLLDNLEVCGDEPVRLSHTLVRKTNCVRNENVAVNVHCFCQSTQWEAKSYLSCHFCQKWYHGDCVNIVYAGKGFVNRFICPDCSEETGFSSTFHSLEAPHRRETRSSSSSKNRPSERIFLRVKRAKFAFDTATVQKVCGYESISIEQVQHLKDKLQKASIPPLKVVIRVPPIRPTHGGASSSNVVAEQLLVGEESRSIISQSDSPENVRKRRRSEEDQSVTPRRSTRARHSRFLGGME
eukprot:TRINITY_DN5988_c0_g1_i1.p1 TRINITY_DN5988_c0_g1~~TRINITY_DN5988_c0_g1_i1.p1  ORF type:complete len:993 (-),score=214.65 TRINITY_DN5988_c0_g1_i1:1096-3900(-)